MTDINRVFREKPGVWAATQRRPVLKQFVADGLLYFSAAVLALFCIIPILWGFSTSFKFETDVYATPPQWIPQHFTFANYLEVFNNPAMLRYFLNSSIISVGCTVLSLIIAVLAAYGFSRYRFAGKQVLLWSILFTRILPRVTIIIPFFVLLRDLRLINTYPGLIWVYLIIVTPLAVWLLKGYIDSVPYEIEEAAIVDGCSPLKILTHIILPIAMPAVSAVGMYAFILAWNEFLFAFVMTNGISVRPISIGLAFYIDEGGIHWGPLTAASMLMSIPAFIVFGLFQKRLIQGLSEGAVKG